MTTLPASEETVAWPNERVNIPDPNHKDARIVGFRIREGDEAWGELGLSEPLFWLEANIRRTREQAVRECAENVWQPIETAPRDGTPILAFNSRHMSHAPVVVEWKEVELDPDLGPEPHWADSATASGTALYYNGLYFDYWMPTPAFTSLSQVRAKK